MVGKISTTAAILRLIFVISAFLSVNAQLKITKPVSVGNCSGSTAEEVLMPCLEMANQITVSPELRVKNFTNSSDLILKKLVVRLVTGLLLSKDFNLEKKSFGEFCKSISEIATCMNNTVTNCTNKELGANVNKTMIRKKLRQILRQAPLTGKGDRGSCDPTTGTVTNSFMNRLKNTTQQTIKDCINSTPLNLRKAMVRTIENIGRATVDPDVDLKAKGRAAKVSKAVCRKLDGIMVLFKIAARCSSKKCNGKTVGGFGRLLQNFLSIPGVKSCGKDVKDDESTERKGNKESKERETANFIGLGHIRNPKIGENFETCVIESGEKTLLNSESVVINATIVKRRNATGHEYSYMTKVTVVMFGDKENCGKAGDTPAKTIAMGEGITTSTINTKTKCGKKNILVKTLETKQSGSSRLRIVDQCAAIAMIVRCLETKDIGKVCYLTIRLSKSVEMAGELFSGCTNQVTVPGVSDNTARRKKRAIPSIFVPVANYDFLSTKNPALKEGIELTASDDTAAVEADSESLGGSGSQLAATGASIVFAVTALALNR